MLAVKSTVTTDTRVFVSSLETTAPLAVAGPHPRPLDGRERQPLAPRQVWGEDREHGRNARRACNLALLRSALLGLLLRDGSLNLSALSQDYASHPPIALRLLRAKSPCL